MSDLRTRIVEQGYDVIGDMFADWRDRIVGDPRRHWANELVSRLSDGDRVLEPEPDGEATFQWVLARR